MDTASQFARNYVKGLKDLLDRLPYEILDSVVQLIDSAHSQRRQVFLVGNGGSAATASHMMNDLNKGVLGHKGDAPWARMRAIALTDNVSLLTAWANDSDYTRVFSEPLRNLAQRDDLMVAISASGNSPNIIAAVDVARELGLKVIGLAGFGGGKLAQKADVCFVVPSDQYGPVEDVHMILDHIITAYLYEKLLRAHRE